MKHLATHIALHRFGLGGRPGEAAQIAGDPRAFVEAQLAGQTHTSIAKAELRPSADILRELQLALREADDRRGVGTPPGKAPAKVDGSRSAKPATALMNEAEAIDLTAKHDRLRDSDHPLLERLVSFWSAHFTVAIRKSGVVRSLAGAYEREAIRPHILGRFSDLLSAVVHHPAMLMYLDNNISAGPSSVLGRTRSRGLNENLARELLELHTLGVDGGYSQADVTNLALILTGWTIAGPEQKDGAGRFKFVATNHEPGRFVVGGNTYGGRGLEDGVQALNDLAKHPSTARHIARKLVTHFVADDAPKELIERLAATFDKTGGNLKEVTLELIRSEIVWSTAPRKIVPPLDFITGLERGFRLKLKPKQWRSLAAGLGQPLWDPPSPKGWPSNDDAWMGPAALRERLRIAEFVAVRMGGTDPRALASELLGAALSPATASAIARAEALRQGHELLIMSPEMLRR